ncbi:MAG TPA: MBL fold metallo-hydrolase, partial [Longimicrobiales bacterium]|nr:MBL fold metallo-hydrolase [Longimicrobiales bacterium]
MPIRYVAPLIPQDPDDRSEFTADLRGENGDRLTELLWGDPVHVLDDSGDPVEVRARARRGFLPANRLTEEGLLELYVIDVGQGDGVLIRTPDDRWHLVDAGVANRSQMTGKGAANFLRWKFQEALQRETVELENVILSHPDYDHYGGLLDLFRGEVSRPDRTFPVRVGTFYHPGLGRFSDAPRLGTHIDGEVDDFPQGYHRIRTRGSFITELLDDRDSFSDPPRDLSGSFEELAGLVATVPDDARRLTHRNGFLPGYGPGQTDVEMRVLGPILEEPEPGAFGLRRLGSQSVTRNGHSVVLRLDYGDARILLTGDLNAKSQRLLLSYHPVEE